MTSLKSNKEKEKLINEIQVQTGSSLYELKLNNKKESEKIDLEQYVHLDSFDEDESEQRFLTSKPTCFLVIGKPGSGKSTIARKLASEWKAELVNPTELIIQNIKSQTELGKKAQDILLKGEAVPEEIVSKMIDDKINSPEVAHHGYVLDGFPSQSENNFDIGQQMEMLKNWKLQPDFIINLRISDQDLTRRRIYQKVDPISGNLYVKEMHSPIKKEVKKEESEEGEGEEEEEGEENEEEKSEEPQDEFFAPVPIDVVERLVVRPEDTLPQVESSIISFKNALLHVLEDQMANMDQSFLLELDSNLSPTILMKQLLLRLQSYQIRKAAKPLRMSEPVEMSEEESGGDHFIDTGEIEETLSALQNRRRLSSKFKWRRSKCSFYCPVSLKDGKIVSGKAEFAASFLDKIYLMANENCLNEFLKNPRPYLRRPQPRAPCKVSILGSNYSGKTTLSSILSKKYNAKVIDMKILMEPEFKKANEELLEKTRQETIQNTMDQIKIKFKEKMDQDRIRKDVELAERAASEAQDNSDNQDSSSQEGTQDEASGNKKVEKINGDLASSSGNDKLVYQSGDGEIVVDPEHPEIKSAVEKALEEISRQSISLPATDYIKVLQVELEKIRKERAKIETTAPSDGGWILDNFPNDSDQLNTMVENNIIPDTFIVLQDSSEDSNVLVRRWYNANRKEIDEKISKRLAEEEVLRAQQFKKEVELKKSQQIDIHLNDESETEKKAADLENVSADGGGENQDDDDLNLKRETLEKIVEEDETRDANALLQKIQASGGGAVLAATATAMSKLDSDSKTFQTGTEPRTPLQQTLPSKGSETNEFLNQVKTTLDSIKSIQNTVITLTGSEPTILEINKKSHNLSDLDDVKGLEDLSNEAAIVMEKIFKFQAVDFEGTEEEEQEEAEEERDDFEEEEEEDEGEEEGDESSFDQSLKEKKVSFGETSHYCPVALSKRGVLIPGNPEFQCKYRERFYRFSSDEAKQSFFENPDNYLPNSRKKSKIPSPRILIMGPRGSGKSTQARFLAEKLNIFHVRFRDYLQELIIGKVKKQVEPEREEDKEEEEAEEEEDEEEMNEKKTKVVEPLPELSEREETIKAYLEKDEALPPEIIDEVLIQLWNEEPFKSRGFVLEGFPNNETHAQYLIEKGLFPDAAVILKIEDEDLLKRLLPPRLEAWKAKMRAKKEKKMAKAAKKKEKLMKQIKERREEEIAKFEERRQKKEEEAAENGDEYEEEEFDVEAIIQEEFADQLQEEEEVEEVQEDEVKENMINDIRTRYENEMSSIDLSKDALQEAFVPHFTIESNRKPNIVRFLIKKKIKRFIDFRQSLFERVYPIKLKIATKLLDFGYKQLSRFGRWCPVKLLDGEPVQTLYDEKKKPYPVIHRSYIYFMSSKEARDLFTDDPIKYLKQASPLSVVPFRLSVIGPPKCGKTTLANRFVKEFGCVRLSVGEAIRAILENQPYSELADNIRAYLVKGKTVPDELAVQCIEIAILDVKCQLRGYVLDNFPVSKQQIKLMTDRCLIPVKVIELKCDIKETMQRCIKDRTSAERLASGQILNDSPEIIGYKLREWKNEIGFIRDWYINEHKNLVQLDGQQSKWSLWEQAKDIGFDSIKNIQIYLNKISNQKAACIAKLCVTYDEMINRLGDFGQYCPVSLALYDELVDCSENRLMDFVAEYQSFYYKMFSQKELDLFLESPEKYVPPLASRKLPPPSQLPKKRTAVEVKELFPKPIELNGYCPVTYFEGKLRYESLEQGFAEYAAEYKNKLFFTANREMLEMFLRKPEQYASLKLPHKLPPVKSSINVFNLPMTGYLEQTVADLIKKALTEAGTFKPKFPFLSPTKSVLLYIAYYLKAYNPKASEYRRKKYKQKLIYFEQKCQLIDFLYKQTTLKYKEPNKRSPEYNIKLDSFLALQENIPTMNWLA